MAIRPGSRRKTRNPGLENSGNVHHWLKHQSHVGATVRDEATAIDRRMLKKLNLRRENVCSRKRLTEHREGPHEFSAKKMAAARLNSKRSMVEAGRP